ncbi:hypothetical protein [Bradyrhizobium sp. CB3481]|uniref:hypothetical protein n=1 Tax=Bradyrhizobium sp. CB3481 TaxID=3039158 RepID=UPI0024B157B4|nr:hypothetical protein [Bradyrhizobium sp. CB3481]WFU14702.1 hypothetical protein QA643_26960 [Bradyrhizobium sp. CB3481]
MANHDITNIGGDVSEEADNRLTAFAAEIDRLLGAIQFSSSASSPINYISGFIALYATHLRFPTSGWLFTTYWIVVCGATPKSMNAMYPPAYNLLRHLRERTGDRTTYRQRFGST